MDNLYEYFKNNEQFLLSNCITPVGKDKNNILSYKVNSFSSFEQLISFANQLNYLSSKTVMHYYRGVTNHEYDLLCSLTFNGLEEEEADIINSLYTQSPESFSKCKTDFEMVALMQHYGLPTRLLDFTKNPHIALWFACQKDANNSYDTDGAVYFTVSCNNLSKGLINTIFKTATKSLFDSIGKSMTREELSEYILNRYGFCDSMFFLNAPVFDQRERNQQSVFLLGTNELVIHINKDHTMVVNSDNFFEALYVVDKSEVDYRYEFRNVKCYNKDTDSIKIVKIIIPKSLKQSILTELSYRGIDETFIFPTLDNYCKAVKVQGQKAAEDRRVRALALQEFSSKNET